MNVGSIVQSSLFLDLPPEVRKEKLDLIEEVNRKHLHVEPGEQWEKVCWVMTELIADKYLKKSEKTKETTSTDPAPRLFFVQQCYTECFKRLKEDLENAYKDPEFTDKIMHVAQRYLFNPFKHNAELLDLLINWVGANSVYLPLGKHLHAAFQADMEKKTLFYRHRLFKCTICPEAQSREVSNAMLAFLTSVADINSKSVQECAEPKEKSCTVLMLSVKNGAGGHTAPNRAMTARLQERGIRVETIHYDTDLTQECDPFRLLDITFEDGTPMTKDLFHTRWDMPKHNKKVAKIVECYVNAMTMLYPSHFRRHDGKDLLQKVTSLRPRLIVTTCAYHWSWKSIAYRLAGCKTLLVASDVFFNSSALNPWFRQQEIPKDVRQLYFTAMTDDVSLLRSDAKYADEYQKMKTGKEPTFSEAAIFEDLTLDEQISVIGIPVNPLFTCDAPLQELRKKWKVPDGAISVTISRGKLGYDADLLEALLGYRTTKPLTKPLILHVVCGENDQFYNKLKGGEYGPVGPNITIYPYPLLEPKSFAELRAISIIDDIKAGGASTFEGWYLISQGTKTRLLLTPGPDLFWEKANCEAMEKWGVGVWMKEGMSKIDILEDIIKNGVKPIQKPFPDWKKPFDEICDTLRGVT